MSLSPFLYGCIPLRLVMAILVGLYGDKRVAVGLFIIGLAFATLYFTNTRLAAPEGGGVTWWASWRWVHALTYITAAIVLGAGCNKSAAAILMGDLVFGIALRLHIKGEVL